MRYTRRTAHPAVFMEMRLGKTLTATRTIELYRSRDPRAGLRVLIAAPNSALGSWERELQTEGFGRDLQFLQGTRDQRLELLRHPKQWNLVNKEAHLSIPELADVKWDAVVIDESTSISKPKPKITKFHLKKFRHVPHRWVLTGTPNPQSDLDYWCQLAFLDGEAFGCDSYWRFRAKYFECPPWGYDWQPKVGAATMIKQEVAKRAFVLTRKECGLDVPKVYERRTLELPKTLRKAYNGVEEDMILDYRGAEVKRTTYAPVKMHWLRQLCGGYVDGELKWKGKLIELASLLDGELARDQVVVWFSYNAELHDALQYLRKRKVDVKWATGDTPPEGRRRLEAEFLDGGFRVFLLQVAIGDFGLDLSAADTAIYYSPPYGPLRRSQSEERILAVYKDGPLLIIDLVVEDSVDTAMLDSLQARVYGQKWNMGRVVKLMEKQREARRAKA